MSHHAWSAPDDAAQLATLKRQLIDGHAPTRQSLRVSGAVALADLSDPSPVRTRFDGLVAAAAWTDAALALLDDALPRWHLRRLVYDEGEWHCALSQRRELPDWLDDAVESHHPNRAAALLLAVIDVLLQDPPAGRSGRGAAWRRRPLREGLVCCENFA